MQYNEINVFIDDTHCGEISVSIWLSSVILQLIIPLTNNLIIKSFEFCIAFIEI